MVQIPVLGAKLRCPPHLSFSHVAFVCLSVIGVASEACLAELNGQPDGVFIVRDNYEVDDEFFLMIRYHDDVQEVTIRGGVTGLKVPGISLAFGNLSELVARFR